MPHTGRGVGEPMWLMGFKTWPMHHPGRDLGLVHVFVFLSSCEELSVSELGSKNYF